ncbi:hypothetical protein B1H58_16220 [Pantoea alhagi]|uniref:Uncharacterized protein n=1 Tax=Pantoea alhagi TaxID=1891675 RepID=A0A1W6B8J5_9GAMM|nr:hypothetical protein [Pantoea alhagi]ARJ43428.1 hypothetical protein B1H58_16220 [Pantoea alhagi]
MKIACLAWGSLIWKPENLPLAFDWNPDGPVMPIEFSRVGDQGELATAICMNAPPVQVYWALLDTNTLQHAISSLREREKIPDSREDSVGKFLLKSMPTGVLANWAVAQKLDAVIWTALPPRFSGLEGRIPCAEDILEYLGLLEGEKLQHAQNYLKKVPANINTPYRKLVREQLGWDC